MPRMADALRLSQAVVTQELLVTEREAMDLFEISSACINPLLAACNAHTSTVSAGSAGEGGWATLCQAYSHLKSIFRAWTPMIAWHGFRLSASGAQSGLVKESP